MWAGVYMFSYGQVLNPPYKKGKYIVTADVPTGSPYHGIGKHGILRTDGKIEENLQKFRHFFPSSDPFPLHINSTFGETYNYIWDKLLKTRRKFEFWEAEEFV
jgi:hypothetical protein